MVVGVIRRHGLRWIVCFCSGSGGGSGSRKRSPFHPFGLSFRIGDVAVASATAAATGKWQRRRWMSFGGFAVSAGWISGGWKRRRIQSVGASFNLYGFGTVSVSALRVAAFVIGGAASVRHAALQLAGIQRRRRWRWKRCGVGRSQQRRRQWQWQLIGATLDLIRFFFY